MKTYKLQAGADFPALSVSDLNDALVDITRPTGESDWQMVVIYRGRIVSDVVPR